MLTVNKNTLTNPNNENNIPDTKSDCFLEDCQIIPPKNERMIAP